MWALRRASIHLRNRCLSLETTRICTVKSEIGSYCWDGNAVVEDSSSWPETRRDDGSMVEGENDADEKKSPKTEAISGLTQFILACREFAEAYNKWDRACNEVTGKEVSSTVRIHQSRRILDKACKNLRDKYVVWDDNAMLEDSSSWPETRRDDESMVKGESDADEKKSPKTEAISGWGWTQVILACREFAKAYDEWDIEACNEVTRTEVSSTVRSLQSRRIFDKACKNMIYKFMLSSLAWDDTLLEDSSSWRYDESMFESMYEGENDADEKKFPKTDAISGLTQVILSASEKELIKALDKWVEAGNVVTRTEVSSTVKILQSRRIFAKACKLYEWLESGEKIEFTENEYACRVDFIAKVQGLSKAEEYIQQIPESFRSEIVYTSLLRNYILAANNGYSNLNQTEKLFNKMKDLFPLTCISCDQMLLLYKKRDREKFADIMEFMMKENIKKSKTTYLALIDLTGQSDTFWEMDYNFKIMKSKGVELSLHNRASMAKYYAYYDRSKEAEVLLKDMEGGDLVKNRAACYYLLPVYASLRRGDEVGRIWKECESDPNLGECIAAVKAFGELKRIEEAEAVFEKMLNTLERRTSSYLYAILLNVYADHKMVTEGEDLFKRMRESCVTIHIRAWDALVKLYIGVGELEKADTVLEEAIRQKTGRPCFASFWEILMGYAKNRGDVHNAKKILMKMMEAGYNRGLFGYSSVNDRINYWARTYACRHIKFPCF